MHRVNWCDSAWRYGADGLPSRYIVGAHVHNSESAALAVDLMKEIFGVQGVPHVVHADRGTSMTSKLVATSWMILG